MKLIVRLLIVSVLAVALPVRANDAASSPVGRWHTISDVDGKPRGIVEIVEEDGMLIGRVVGSLRTGEGPARICERCPGARKGKPMLGLAILSGLRRRGEEWSGGEVLDPDTGSVYRATLRLADRGKKLLLHAYVGVPWMGRTQVWLRQE